MTELLIVFSYVDREDWHLVDSTLMQNCEFPLLFSISITQTIYAIYCYSLLLGCFIDRRRESTDVEDLFIAHISGMDTLARGLRNVAKLIEVVSLFLTFSCHFNFSMFYLSFGFWVSFHLLFNSINNV